MNMTEREYGILFEMASQMKFRYPLIAIDGTQGRNLTTEELWDLTPAELDLIYINLQKELMDIGGCGLIPPKYADDGVKANDIRNKMEIVKYIFEQHRLADVLDRIAFEQ